MAGHTYRITEVVGTSEIGVEDAIQAAVRRPSETVKGLDWFEVANIRGQISDDNVAWYQVTMKIGFRLMSDEELAKPS